MDNKYYTPKLSDFYPGYEYEQYAPGTGDEYRKMVFGPTIEEARFIKPVYQQGYESGWFRTAYLTKEQIESEGWHHAATASDGGTMIFGRDKYFTLSYHGENGYYKAHKPELLTRITVSKINSEDLSRDTLFQGEIKSINEFKTLMKWLNIM